MKASIRSKFCLAALLMAGGSLVTASANVVQDATVTFMDNHSVLTSDYEHVEGPSTAITNSIWAHVGGNRFDAAGAVGPAGDLGTTGQLITAGRLGSRIHIWSDESVNLTAQPQHAISHFIIDGGLMDLSYAPNASVFFSLEIGATFAMSGGNTPATHWSTSALLAGGPDSGRGAAAAFFTSGTDIGMAYDGVSHVTIPLSLQTIDFGMVPPGAALEIDYLLRIEAQVPVYAEFPVDFAYSDPLHVEMPGELFPKVEFVPVPEPGTNCMMIAGCLLLGIWRLPKMYLVSSRR